MLFRRRAGAESRRRRFRRHFRSNCAGLRRIAMRIGAGFPVGCCDKSCTLFRRLRRICALADIVCSGGTCDDLRTRNTDGRRSSNVRSLHMFHRYLPLVAHSAVALALYATSLLKIARNRKRWLTGGSWGRERGSERVSTGSESCWNAIQIRGRRKRWLTGGCRNEIQIRFLESGLHFSIRLHPSVEKQQQQQRNDNIFIR